MWFQRSVVHHVVPAVQLLKMLKATHDGLVMHWIKLTLTAHDGSPEPAPRSHLCTLWAPLVHEDPPRPPKPRATDLGITGPSDPWFQTHPHGRFQEARGNYPCRRPKAQLRYVMWQMRPILLQNAADVVWGCLIPGRVSNEGWTRTNYMIHHITGLGSPHQGHHSYILKLKLEKSGMKRNKMFIAALTVAEFKWQWSI